MSRCMQKPFIWLILCGQVYEPPKNRLGCNLLIIGALQPNSMDCLNYLFILDSSLRRSSYPLILWAYRNIGKPYTMAWQIPLLLYLFLFV